VVRNLEDGRVEVQVEGEQSRLETFIETLRKGPRLARVDDLQVLWEEPTGRHVGFHIWP
jgi:acylphosphatase